MNTSTLPKISKELNTAVKNLIKSKAEVSRIKPIIDAINQNWINENKPQLAAEWQEHESGRQILPHVITKISDAWMMEDVEFERYLKETEEKKREAGFEFEPEYCPLLIAERKVIDAENDIIKYSSCVTGESDLFFTKMDKRKEFIELIISLVASAPKEIFA